MGFGILFLGYFVGFIMFVGHLAILRVVSALATLFAAYKLSKYNVCFKPLIWISLASIAFYGVVSVFDILEYLNIISIEGTATRSILSYPNIPMTFLFHAALLYGIRKIAIDTDVPKITFAATRNFIFHVILLALELISILPFTVTRNMFVLSVVVALILAVLNLILIFKCYANICDINDVDMEKKNTKKKRREE